MKTRPGKWLRCVALVLAPFLGLGHAPTASPNGLDALGDRLSVISNDGSRWARLSAMTDVIVFMPERPASGSLIADETPFVAPRTALFLDAALGSRLSVHAQARVDRGFDPGRERNGDARVDEYFIDALLFEAGKTTLRAGKFATVFGAWVERHLAWDNPLITAPALYEDLVTITDRAAPADFAVFNGRRDLPDNKQTWVPVVWGPSYATGASLAMQSGSVDMAIEVKNGALSSRPESWSAVDHGFEAGATVTGRLGWRPRAEWTLGLSGSHGPYLREAARSTLPVGRELGDFSQTTLAADLTYELHRLQVWAELARSSFEVPRVGDLGTYGGFVEVRYKVAPQWWLAGRWNQSWFDDTPTLEQTWDRDLRRLDLAVGYRHDAHIQAKLEYSLGDQSGGDTNGNQHFAAQIVIWF